MKRYLVKTPSLVKRFFPNRTWAFPKKEKTIFLTFDDGPIPNLTPWVLQELKKVNAKATFFCIGDNVTKHTEIFSQIINEGHAIGNHTFHHINGWKTSAKDYLIEVNKCEEAMHLHIPKKNSNKHSLLFRPPYGRLSVKQEKQLIKQGYAVVMWDVLSADFDSSITPEKCLSNVTQNIQEGSIVVFHDSVKAEENLRYALPKILQFIAKKGWKCCGIY